MIQIFDQLDKIAEGRFEFEKGWLLERYKDMALSEGVLTESEVNRNTIGSIRNIYILRVLDRERTKIYQYIDEKASGATDKDALTLFVENLFNKVGTLRKGFQKQSLMFFENLRNGKIEDDRSYPANIYSSVSSCLDELQNKIEKAYGHLLSQDLLDKYSDKIPLNQELIDLFNQQNEKIFDDFVKGVRVEVAKTKTLKGAIAFVQNYIQGTKQGAIRRAATRSAFDKNKLDPQTAKFNQRCLDWLQVELESLQQLGKLYPTLDESGAKMQLHKIHTKLTVNQMSYLLKLMRDEKIFYGHAGTLEQLVVQYFSSKQAEDMKQKSFHNGASEISETEKEELKDMLHNLLKHINTNLPKDKKK